MGILFGKGCMEALLSDHGNPKKTFGMKRESFANTEGNVLYI